MNRRLFVPPDPEKASPKPGRGDRPGRNDPCSCGSGLKYKKCCLPAEGTVTIDPDVVLAAEEQEPGMLGRMIEGLTEEIEARRPAQHSRGSATNAAPPEPEVPTVRPTEDVPSYAPRKSRP